MKIANASKICFICNYVKSHNVHNQIFVSSFRVFERRYWTIFLTIIVSRRQRQAVHFSERLSIM